MTNMPHCRFENTLAAMTDCWEQVESLLDRDVEVHQRLTDPRERRARAQLLELCADIVARLREEGLEEDEDDPLVAIDVLLDEAETELADEALLTDKDREQAADGRA